MILNEQQQKAINSDKKNIVIIAGAGSGKTSVFVEKIKKDLKTLEKNEILALTFTEKASQEFQERLRTDLDYFGTFHSVFYKLLFETGDAHELKIYEESKYNFYLENQYDKRIIDKQFTLKVGTIKDLNEFISSKKEICLKCKNIFEYYEKLNELLEKEMGYQNEDENIIETFYKQKKEDGVISFDDIIIKAYFLVKQNQLTQHKLKNKFKQILVDEFQDTNKIVLETIKMISNNNMFLVGDPFQSIYSFQGAEFENIVKLIKEYDVIQLDTNYRSSNNIVDFANQFINNNLIKLDNYTNIKNSEKKDNENINIIQNISDYTIPKIIDEVGINDTCILARNNNHIKEIKELLDKWNIPYYVNNRNEIEYILDALLLLSTTEFEPYEYKYFKRFLFGFFGVFIDKKDDVLDILKNIKWTFKNDNIEKYLINRGYTEEEINLTIKNFELRVLKIYKNDKYKNVFLQSVKKRLEYWLDNKLYIKKTGVEIMTIHKAKGLEWKNVILYNFEDGIFPKIVNNEEEKRLYYVAITRAKERMYITSKNAINIYTKSIMESDYITMIDTKKEVKKTFEVDYEESDLISFLGDSFEIDFLDINEEQYAKFYDDKNSANILKNYIKDTNSRIQDKKVRSVNNYDEIDVEGILISLEEFIKNAEFENDDLGELIELIDINKDNFLIDEDINYNYINNEFTDYIHRIINFKNFLNEDEIDAKDERLIKKLKKIVLKLISKKNTDITKDKAKKSLEITQRKINEKQKKTVIDNYDDFKTNMIKDYYDKSDKERKFYINNVMGMFDTVNERMMIDLENGDNYKLKEGLLIDFELDENDKHIFKKETLKGNHINNRKKQLAFRKWGKIKYLEYKNLHQDCCFCTFTLSSKWHKWKTKAESLEQERMYGDGSILINNPNFKMQGNNLEEHFINGAREINDIWTYFYSLIKVKLNDEYGNKHEYTIDFFRQQECHKNLTSHQHILGFYDRNITSIIEECFEKTIKQFGLNEKFQDLKMIEKAEDVTLEDVQKYNDDVIELFKIEGELNSQNITDEKRNELIDLKNELKKNMKTGIATPSSYIAKYIIKNAFGEDTYDNQSSTFFNAWESMLGNKVKTNGASNYENTTQLHLEKIYKWYQEYFPSMLNIWKKSPKPLYFWLEKEQTNGNFIFEYKRQVKENFKNGDFLKDVDLIFNLYKKKNLTDNDILDALFDNKRLEHLKDNLSIFSEIIVSDEEDDELIYELAKNFIFENLDSDIYDNIYTNKKLINLSVSKELLDIAEEYDEGFRNVGYLVDYDYKEEEFEVNEKEREIFISLLDIEGDTTYVNEKKELNLIIKKLDDSNNLNIKALINTIKISNISDLLTINIDSVQVHNDETKAFFNMLNLNIMFEAPVINFENYNNKLYKKIYEEGMYIKGYISEEDIANRCSDIELDEAFIKSLENYPNHRLNWEIELKNSNIEFDLLKLIS